MHYLAKVDILPKVSVCVVEVVLTCWSCSFTCCLYATLRMLYLACFGLVCVSCSVQCDKNKNRNMPDWLFAIVSVFLLQSALQLSVLQMR